MGKCNIQFILNSTKLIIATDFCKSHFNRQWRLNLFPSRILHAKLQSSFWLSSQDSLPSYSWRHYINKFVTFSSTLLDGVAAGSTFFPSLTPLWRSAQLEERRVLNGNSQPSPEFFFNHIEFRNGLRTWQCMMMYQIIFRLFF